MDGWGLLRSLLPGAAAVVVVLLLSVLANRKSDMTECKLGWIYRIIMVPGIAMGLVGLYSVLFANAPDDGLNDELWLPLALSVMVIVFGWALLDSSLRRISWDEQGARFRKPGMAERTVPWGEIRTLEYKPLRQYWRVGFSDGRGFMVFEIMNGAEAFLEACRTKATLTDNAD